MHGQTGQHRNSSPVSGNLAKFRACSEVFGRFIHHDIPRGVVWCSLWLLDTSYTAAFFNHSRFKISAFITMDSSRRSIMFYELIKENSGSSFGPPGFSLEKPGHIWSSDLCSLKCVLVHLQPIFPTKKIYTHLFLRLCSRNIY